MGKILVSSSHFDTLMKDGVYLVNAARGSLVDLAALAQALSSGKCKGAALDAFEGEGALAPEGSPILNCENLILTPHTGMETYEAYRRIGLVCAQNVLAMPEGKPPLYWANKSYF